MAKTERKYPYIKCTKQLWEEIRVFLQKWKCELPYNMNSDYNILCTNYGSCDSDEFKLDFISFREERGLRYEAESKDEFLRQVAKLLGVSYTGISKSLEKKGLLLLYL